MSSNRIDGEALSVLAEFLSALRRLWPNRCYATQATAKMGLIWVNDLTGREPYETAVVMIKEAVRSRPLVRLRLSDRMIDVILPYREIEVVAVTDLPVRLFGGGPRSPYIAMIKGVDKKNAPKAARVVRDLSRLPPLDPSYSLKRWRIF